MQAKSFVSRLLSRQSEKQSLLCVGLDPDLTRIPRFLSKGQSAESAIVDFNREIIAATAEFACAFKLNLAFYEVHGVAGWKALERTLSFIPAGVLTIADGKRGDIGNTARFYAAAVFDSLGFDSCTVAPYMGYDAVGPFVERPDKCAFVLCRTSNSSADDFQLHGSDAGSHGQDTDPPNERLYQRVARSVSDWNAESHGQLGLVVGATRPDDLAEVRTLAPSLPFLIPGVGAQGGDAAATVGAAMTTRGSVIVNSSRSILYAGAGVDFADRAAVAADSLRKELKAAVSST